MYGSIASSCLLCSWVYILFFNLTYSRWTSSLPSCLWSLRILPSLPSLRPTIFSCEASSAILQLVNQWLNLTHSPRSHAFRYGRNNKPYFGKNRTHDFRTSRYAGYLLDHSGDERQLHLEYNMSYEVSYCSRCEKQYTAYTLGRNSVLQQP